MITVHANSIKCKALVDTGCSQSLMSRVLCHSWMMKEVDVLRSVRILLSVKELDLSNLVYATGILLILRSWS